MLNWLYKFFDNTPEKDKEDALPLPSEDSIPKMPKVEPPKKLDISEPVLSFVQTVKDNPRRFKVSCQKNIYTLHDNVEKLSWCATIVDYDWDIRTRSLQPVLYKFPKFLTQDEISFIDKELRAIFQARAIKLIDLKGIRKERVLQKERQKLIDIYCKDK